MRETRILMDMPVTVEIADSGATKKTINEIFNYFADVEDRFSFFRDDSEVSMINRGEIKDGEWSRDMEEIFSLAEDAREKTEGYFSIKTPSGKIDPSGVVKGWAIRNAADILLKKGFNNFYVDAGGDIQAYGRNSQGELWRVGIKNPANAKEVVKVVRLNNEGIATSGTYIRGQHIYNPHKKEEPITDILSLTVIDKDVCSADMFATALFAMGKEGIVFAGNLGLAAYMIDKNGQATMTGNFNKYTVQQ